jgi:hypothetical protein
MSSCAASCCICSPKVSCASATSASWPIADVQPCHFAFSCSVRHKQVRGNHRQFERCLALPQVWWAKGLRLRRPSSVLHRPRVPSPHEASIHITKLCRASARYLSSCLPVQSIPSPQGNPYCTTFELLSNLLLSRLGEVLFCVSPSRRHTYFSSIEFP